MCQGREGRWWDAGTFFGKEGGHPQALAHVVLLGKTGRKHGLVCKGRSGSQGAAGGGGQMGSGWQVGRTFSLHSHCPPPRPPRGASGAVSCCCPRETAENKAPFPPVLPRQAGGVPPILASLSNLWRDRTKGGTSGSQDARMQREWSPWQLLLCNRVRGFPPSQAPSPCLQRTGMAAICSTQTGK